MAFAGYPGPGGMPFNSAALNYPPRMLRHPSDGVPYGQHRSDSVCLPHKCIC